MDLLDALKKMTLMPAERLNLTQKGTIEVGKDADLVIFNPETIHDNASYEDPKAKPSGIDYVLIHGKIALEGQTIINGTLGKFIPSQL
jgi:N-acyl-D-amino-acid deacylase